MDHILKTKHETLGVFSAFVILFILKSSDYLFSVLKQIGNKILYKFSALNVYLMSRLKNFWKPLFPRRSK